MPDPTPGPFKPVRVRSAADGRSWHKVIGHAGPNRYAPTLLTTRDRDPSIGDDEDRANAHLLGASWTMLKALRAWEVLDGYDSGKLKMETLHAVLQGLGWDGTGSDLDFMTGLRNAAIEAANAGEATT